MTENPFFIPALPKNASYCMRREFRDVNGRTGEGVNQLL